MVSALAARLRLLLLAALALVLTADALRNGSAAAAETDGRVTQVLLGDERLTAPISPSLREVPLGAALPALGRELGLTLTSRAELRDEKVTLLVDGRPAAEVLSLLARHFGGRWSRTSGGYELAQERAEQSREAKLREAELAAEWSEVTGWMTRLEQLLARPRRELETRANTATAEPERAALQQALHPLTPAAVAVFRSLRGPQLAQVRAGTPVLLSAETRTLSPRALELIRGTEPLDRGLPFQDPSEIPAAGDAQVLWMEGFSRAGPPRPHERRATLRMELIQRRDVDGQTRWRPLSWTPALPERPPNPPRTTETEDPELLRVVELPLPPSRRAASDDAYHFERREWPDRVPLSQAAAALHAMADLDFLADSYVRARVDRAALSGRQPVVRILDTLARELDYTWEKEGSLILLRSRTWYRDRVREIPDRVLHPWRSRAARTRHASLDQFAELAAALDDEQTLGASLYWGWYFEQPWVAPLSGGVSGFHAQRQHLRLWASLSAAQRAEAQSGITPVARMSGAQQRAFLRALGAPAISPWGSGAEFFLRRRPPTLPEVSTGGLRLTSAEWRLQAFTGTAADGKQTQIVAQYPAYRPPNLGNLPSEFQWATVGMPARLDTLTFAYHLAAEEKPARTVEISVARALPDS